MKNLFETAVYQNETSSFFRGEGKYFVPSPDYEGHSHGAHMGGYARTYADSSLVCSREFDQAFLAFIESLKVCKEDLNHLLANLSAYFAQKSRGGFANSNIFSNKASKGSTLLKDYMAEISKSQFSKEVRDQILRHVKFTGKKGNALLMEIVEDLLMAQ